MNSDFLFGNFKRIFLNTYLGCKSNCSYCYLSDLKLKIDSKIKVNKLIELLDNDNSFIKGKNGTIISIGCYSECWDKVNKKDTIDLINKLLDYKNPIQIATKQQITLSDFEEIEINKIKYRHHLSIYISSVSITHHATYEKGTPNPSLRFNSFKIKEKYNIPMFLYLKPIIEKITIQDISLYLDLIKKYNIEVIVGKLFETSGTTLAPISNGILKYTNKKNKDNENIFNILQKHTKVYETSMEPILKGVK